MKRISPVFLISLLLLCWLGACSEQATAPTAPSDPETQPQASPPEESRWVQNYLTNLWKASNHDDWDIMTTSIDPVAGGTVTGTPASWPAGYSFTVSIPPASIINPVPTGLADLGPIEPEPIEISIHVPKYRPGVPVEDQHPAVYKLEPHGLEFNVPIDVTFCYPPWRPEDTDYYKFHFWREDVGGEWFYHYSDLEILQPFGGGSSRLDVRFQTTHFSRWGMENGSGGGGIEDLIDDGSDPTPDPIRGGLIGSP